MKKPKTVEDVMDLKVQIEKDRADAYKQLLEQTMDHINDIVNNRIKLMMVHFREITSLQRHPIWSIYEKLCNMVKFLKKSITKCISWLREPLFKKDGE